MANNILDFTKAQKRRQIAKARETMNGTEWAVLGPLVEAHINPEGIAEKLLPAMQKDWRLDNE